jgi:putative transcription factor
MPSIPGTASQVGQDWTPVVIHKKNTTDKNTSNVSEQERQRRNKLNALETDIEEGNLKHKTIEFEVRKQIMQARLAKKMSQADLAKALNLRPNQIQEIESGKAQANPQVLSKISKNLGIKFNKK